MIHIVTKEEFEKDGVTYIREIYSNGATVEYPKPLPQPPSPEWEQDLIDEEQEAILEERMNIQYLVDLTEINTEEE